VGYRSSQATKMLVRPIHSFCQRIQAAPCWLVCCVCTCSSSSGYFHRIQVFYTCRPSCEWRPSFGSHRNKKSHSIFQVKNNKISQDVKGLFLSHRFLWSRVIVKVPMLQLGDKLLGKGQGNVRCQRTNGRV
jgi:hypothetical protein